MMKFASRTAEAMAFPLTLDIEHEILGKSNGFLEK